MKAKSFTWAEEEEIAERIRSRIRNSNKQLMAEYGCSRSLIDRISREVRVETANVPRKPWASEKSNVIQHPVAFRDDVSRMIDVIQDEDRARLLEPAGPKTLLGRRQKRRPKTAIISEAAACKVEERIKQSASDGVANGLGSGIRGLSSG